jgi:hypothetical protein
VDTRMTTQHSNEHAHLGARRMGHCRHIRSRREHACRRGGLCRRSSSLATSMPADGAHSHNAPPCLAFLKSNDGVLGTSGSSAAHGCRMPCAVSLRYVMFGFELEWCKHKQAR